MTNQVVYFMESLDGGISTNFINTNERKLTSRQQMRVLETTLKAIFKLKEIENIVGKEVLDIMNAYLTFNICKDGVGIVISNDEVENQYNICICLGLNGYEDYIEIKNNNGEDFLHCGLNCEDLIPLLQFRIMANF